jgi:hypothetical protein
VHPEKRFSGKISKIRTGIEDPELREIKAMAEWL